MNNSLILKLKGSVSGDLPYFGNAVLFSVAPSPSTMTFSLKNTGGENIIVECDENALFNNNTHESIIAGGDGSATFSSISDVTKVSICSFYDLERIQCGTGGDNTSKGYVMYDPSAFRFMENLKYLALRGIPDFNYLVYNKNLQYLTSTNNPNKISFIPLATCIKLENLTLGNSQVTGELSDFANSQVQEGRNNGTITIVCGSKMTKNGVATTNMSTEIIKYGSSMENPTAEETAQGWQFV